MNAAFQVPIPLDPKHCTLGILNVRIPDKYAKEAPSRASFQARRLILLHWVSQTPPSLQAWLEQIGPMLLLES